MGYLVVGSHNGVAPGQRIWQKKDVRQRLAAFSARRSSIYADSRLALLPRLWRSFGAGSGAAPYPARLDLTTSATTGITTWWHEHRPNFSPEFVALVEEILGEEPDRGE
jgi:hypothetical protein